MALSWWLPHFKPNNKAKELESGTDKKRGRKVFYFCLWMRSSARTSSVIECHKIVPQFKKDLARIYFNVVKQSSEEIERLNIWFDVLHSLESVLLCEFFSLLTLSIVFSPSVFSFHPRQLLYSSMLGCAWCPHLVRAQTQTHRRPPLKWKRTPADTRCEKTMNRKIKTKSAFHMIIIA